MARIVYVLLAGWILAGAGARAENAAFVIPFGGEPGTPLAHAYDYGAPPVKEGTYLLRVPSADPTVAAVFADFELTVDAASKTVLHSRASRAYRSLTECTAAQKIIEPKLSVVLPAAYSGVNSAWQVQSADGKTVGGVYCQTARHLPFPILTFDLTVNQ